ncbi:MAG: XRE family transcriptional regulator [Tannerella sp.]|jgi:transcriptional regulator with XRE-family HTH domain|nr:XRE family transcriptional regulator [Tannerella sp.]
MENNKRIGEKIRSIRDMKNITVAEMAERSGLSEDEITRIESDEYLPSLAPLIKIARTLGVRLGTFLDDQNELGPVVHRKSSLVSDDGIGFTNNSVSKHKYMSYHSLSQDKTGRHMEPFLINVKPADKADFIFSTHEGEEFIYVIEGNVEVNYGKKTYLLDEGDSIYYDSIVAHHVHAAGEKDAKILGVIYTPY